MKLIHDLTVPAPAPGLPVLLRDAAGRRIRGVVLDPAAPGGAGQPLVPGLVVVEHDAPGLALGKTRSHCYWHPECTDVSKENRLCAWPEWKAIRAKAARDAQRRGKAKAAEAAQAGQGQAGAPEAVA